MSASPATNISADSGWSHASGKAILFGEHAVVYGVRAIAAGLSRGVFARSEPAATDALFVEDRRLDAGHALMSAVAAMREFLGAGPATVRLRSELPQGAGLGSSAAMAVATGRALEKSHGFEASARRLFEAAQIWEQVFHGTPSGIDVAAAQSNSIIGFTRGEEPEQLSLCRPLPLVIVQAGPPASTKLMVESVAKNRARNRPQFEKNLQAIDALVKNAALLLKNGDLPAVGQLMDLNHMLLASWMLSTEDIETAISIARAHGALGAKLTGAGGGGCVVALAADVAGQTRIVKAFENTTMPAFSATVGEDRE